MYKGIVLNELLLKIVTEVKSPKLNTNTVVLTNRNSYLILGKSISVSYTHLTLPTNREV